MTKPWDSTDWREGEELAPEERNKQVRDQKSRLYYGELNDNDLPPKDAVDVGEGARFLDEYNRIWEVIGSGWELQPLGDPDNRIPVSFFDGINSEDFRLTIRETNAPIDEGSNLNVEVEVDNQGDSGKQEVVMKVDSEVVQKQDISVSKKSKAVKTFTWETGQGDAGTHNIKIISDNDSVSTSIDVNSVPEFAITITSTNTPISDEDSLDVDFDVTNNGSSSDTQTLELVVGDTVRDSQDFNLNSGDTVSGTMNWKAEDTVAGDYTAEVRSVLGSDTAEVRVTASDGPFLVPTITGTNTPITDSDTLTVNLDVENTGTQEATQDVKLIVDGSQRDINNDLTVSAGGTKSITLEWTNPNVGNFDAKVETADEDDTESVRVETTGVYFGVEILNTNAPLQEGATLQVDVKVENLGDSSGTQTIELKRDGNLVDDNQDVSLSPDETAEFTLTWASSEGDSGSKVFTVSSDDESKTINISISNLQTDNAGIIIHESPGKRVDGVQVDKDFWVEVFGQEVHLSRR